MNEVSAEKPDQPACCFVVAADPSIREHLLGIVGPASGHVAAFPTVEAVRSRVLEHSPPQVVLVTALGEDPTTDVQALRQALPRSLVVVLAAKPTVEEAVAVLRAGACDYRLLPNAETGDRALIECITRLATPARRADVHEIIASHPSMREILAKIDAIAATKATVLLRGESGTGKTLLARRIHGASDRRHRRLVEFSCGSLPDPLLESELFGHERGAFTGADRARQGKFEFADGGTLFLDEIGSASAALQVKLLRVLQDRVFERLGDNEPRRVDVRLVLATNIDLGASVADGRFREDLYYRINVVTLTIPPLRDRKEDIIALARRFAAHFAKEYAKPCPEFEPDVALFFLAHDWPGNVRELENAVEHAVLLCRDDVVRTTDLPERYVSRFSVTAGRTILPLKRALEAPEREYIRRVLELNGGSRSKTAAVLGVNRTTLFNKMRRLGLG